MATRDNPGCMARQYSDSKVCSRCGFTWDVNDPEPPKCKTEREVSLDRLAKIRESVRRSL